MSDQNWNNNAIQFPRLLCEINATQDLDISTLAKAMGLHTDEISELFDRAHTVWNRIKAPKEPNAYI